MSDEEDCDDLPPITVNSSTNGSSSFTMPTAEELASQRARELACEAELEQLRARHADVRAAPLQHSDSSGSEAELALAAAVTALDVRARAAPAAPAAPAAAALWAALAPRLPPPAAELRPERLHMQRAVAAVAAALAGERADWPDDEMLSACALLCAAALAHESRCRRVAARTLHALLDDRATPAQVSSLVAVLAASFPAARTRLQLSDALRSGGDAGADRAAAALAAAALLELLQPGARGPADVARVAGAAGAWRARGAGARLACVRLAGRVLAAGARAPLERDARARLLQHLAPPPAAASDAQRPDRLKVLVGASKLRLLFRTEQ